MSYNHATAVVLATTMLGLLCLTSIMVAVTCHVDAAVAPLMAVACAMLVISVTTTCIMKYKH